MARLSFLLLGVLLSSSCELRPPEVALHPADAPPARLNDWHLLHADGERLQLNEGVLPYALNTPLFSDYALKLRTVWMPDGEAAQYRDEREFEFPAGTILSKTFHYRRGAGGLVKTDGEAVIGSDGVLELASLRLIETRLLVRYADGWRALPYVWNDEQTEAYLALAGDQLELVLDDEPLTYIVPDMNQCGACHTPDHTGKELRPLGLKAHQLNRESAYADRSGNQLDEWAASGRLTGLAAEPPRSARWSNRDAESLDALAKVYLDVNCGHCHNPRGAADTSALLLNLEAPLDRRFGICKPPVAVGRGSGNRPYDIFPGRPDASILMFRVAHDDPAIMMPELGRTTSHVEGVALLKEWIARLPGDC